MKIFTFVNEFLSKLGTEIYNFLKFILIFTFGLYAIHIAWNFHFIVKIALIAEGLFIIALTAITTWQKLKIKDLEEQSKKMREDLQLTFRIEDPTV